MPQRRNRMAVTFGISSLQGRSRQADLVQIVKQGKSYLNVHTVNNPGGEINGHFTLANGASSFTPPPRPPTWTDDHANSNSVARFLQQATFGPRRPISKQ